MTDLRISGGERHNGCDCEVDQKTIVGKGSRKHPFKLSGIIPVQPAVPQMTPSVYYARPDGNDKHDGRSPETAVRTFQKLVTLVPASNANTPGVTTILDITGIEEELPPNYTLPAWTSWAVSENPPTSPPDQAVDNFGGGYMIFAEPQPIPGLPLASVTINASDVNNLAFDPITGLMTINLNAPRPEWTTANLLGALCLDQQNFNSSVVYAVNSLSSISVTNLGQGFAAPTYPLTLARPGAWLHGSGDLNQNVAATITANNCNSVVFAGIKITSDNGQWGLYSDGSGQCIAELCELDSPFLAAQSGSVFYSSANRILRSWVYNACTVSGVAGLVQSFLQNATSIETESTPFFCAPTVVTIRRCVFDGCDPIEVGVYEPAGSTVGAASDHVLLQNSKITRSLGDGFIFHGVVANVDSCDFAANTGNAISIEAGGGTVLITASGSSAPNGTSGSGIGIFATDGMQALVDSATATSATPIIGIDTDNSIQVGSQTPINWVTFGLTNNVTDFAGVAATGARVGLM